MATMHIDPVAESIKGILLMVISFGLMVFGKIVNLSIPMQTIQYMATIFSATLAGIYYCTLIYPKYKEWLRKRRQKISRYKSR